MQKHLKLGSLFDGSGTAPLAASMCGIEPVWASEIEPYPIKVTKARFPNVLHLGDITKINGAAVEPVDIICGGSPCQDLSVAGKQAGLHDGQRSHLFFEMTRIIQEMREATNGRYPRYIIWENVPGAFSSNKGRDFLAVLQAFAEIADPDIHVPEPKQKASGKGLAWKYAGYVAGDGWSIAWRTVDAQYWGVPQRRRRIYLVADFRGECADEILFERTGLSGNSEPGREAWKEAPGDAGRSVEGSGGSTVVLMDAYQHHGWRVGETCGTLTAGQNNTIRGDTPLCVYDITGVTSNSMKSPTPDSCFKQRDIRRTLDTFVGSPECNQGGMVVVKSIDCRNMVLNNELSGTLQAKENGGHSLNYQNPVIYDAICVGNGQLHQISMAEQANCLDCMHDQQAVIHNGEPPRKYIVRRLTPLECCRLQGFPDWYIYGCETFPITGWWLENNEWMEVVNPHGEVEGSDSAMYRLWGNGMAFPNMLFIMRRIYEHEKQR